MTTRLKAALNSLNYVSANASTKLDGPELYELNRARKAVKELMCRDCNGGGHWESGAKCQSCHGSGHVLDIEAKDAYADELELVG